MEVNNWEEIIQNALVNPATKEAIAVKQVTFVNAFN